MNLTYQADLSNKHNKIASLKMTENLLFKHRRVASTIFHTGRKRKYILVEVVTIITKIPAGRQRYHHLQH